MRLYLDSADFDAVRRLARWGAFAGVTTNPVILARAGLSLPDAVHGLGAAHSGDLFVQPVCLEVESALAEISRISELLPSRVLFKVPPTPVGLEVMSRLRDERTWIAATALFTSGQGLVAAAAGADVLVPFFDRIRSEDGDPATVVSDLVALGARRGGRPRVLVASLRSVEQVLAVARLGAWGATMPVEVAEELLASEGSEAALARFADAAAAAEE